ncbi:MAG: hypothetical protein IT445_07240 [Phycisphaeraceae bacterium]|nr:hypothetical protein [Phycisphaeraceae bacterium]
MQLKRTFLLCVIAAAATAALFGIWVLLFERFFGIEEEVWGTLGSIVLFCLPAMASAALAERGHWRRLMRATIVLCLLSMGWYLFIVWFHDWIDDWLWDDDWMWKSMFVQAWWALGLTWMGLISVRPLRIGWPRWAQLLTLLAGFLLASVLTAAVITEFDYHDVTTKTMGTLGILAALGTVVVPILVRIDGLDKVSGTESTPLALQITCPRCLLEQTVRSGHSRCQQCRLKFHIEIEEPRCPQCGYLLHMLEKPVCPECGAKLGTEEIVGA